MHSASDTLKYLPSTCPCGKRLDINHATSCMKGGFVHRRHKEVRDLFISLLKDVCHDVEVKPHLQTLTGEVLTSSANCSVEARLDVSARFLAKGAMYIFFTSGFSTHFQIVTLTRNLTRLSQAMRTREKRHYNHRIIEVEHGSFSPVVFSPHGGNGREAERFLTELAQKLSEKKQMDYSIVIYWLRAKLPLNLLRSAVLCVRGSRTTKHELNTDFSEAEIANVIGRMK